jgi:hypothetical protein
LKITKLVAAGVLAAAMSLAQPAAVFAIPNPPPAPAATNAAAVVLPLAWAVGFFACTGLTWGKMQVDADKAHRELTGADAWTGITRCLFPPLGFARLMRGQ